MNAASNAKPSRGAFRTGWVLTALAAFALGASAIGKFVAPPQYVEQWEGLGWSSDLLLTVAIIEAACVVLYLVPQTAILGGVLVAAYMGGATAASLRIGEPWFAAPIIGVIAWLGLWFRLPKLREIAPLRF